MRRDTAGGDPRVLLQHRPFFGDDEGATLQEMAERLDIDEETTMTRLLEPACRGWIVVATSPLRARKLQSTTRRRSR